MKIRDVDFLPLTSPYYEPGVLRNYGVVVIRTDDGRTGLGEPYAGVNMPTVLKEALRLLKPLMVGVDLREKEALMTKMHAVCEYFDHRGMIYCLLGAVEWALWDLAAQEAKLPLHRHLHRASKNSIELYASTGPATWTHARAIEDLESCWGRGFRAAKIRVGCCTESLEDAIARATAVAKRRPRGMRLGVDAGQQIFYGAKCWGLESASKLARALGELDVFFFEDPLLIHDIEGYKALKKLRCVPIAGGEMFAEAAQFEEYITEGAWDVAQPDACVLAGPRACAHVGSVAEMHSVKVIMHGWAGPVAQMQNIHAALAMPSCDTVEFAPFLHPLMEEILAPVWKFKEGRLEAPQKPGMGIQLPADIEKRYPYQDSAVTLIA